MGKMSVTTRFFIFAATVETAIVLYFAYLWVFTSLPEVVKNVMLYAGNLVIPMWVLTVALCIDFWRQDRQ